MISSVLCLLLVLEPKHRADIGDPMQKRNAGRCFGGALVHDAADCDRIAVFHRDLRADVALRERRRIDPASRGPGARERIRDRSGHILIDDHRHHAARVHTRQNGEPDAGTRVGDGVRELRRATHRDAGADRLGRQRGHGTTHGDGSRNAIGRDDARSREHLGSSVVLSLAVSEARSSRVCSHEHASRQVQASRCRRLRGVAWW